MTRTAIAVRHVPFEDLGILEPLLRRRGFTVTYREAPVDDLYTAEVRAVDLLVVLGGPLGANDELLFPFLADERRLLDERLARRSPTLGICLGAQLIARSLGARVYPAGALEVGWMPLSITQPGQRSPLALLGDPPSPVLHWHGDTFDLPARATHLASTPLCPNQAFSLGAALALQFHLEVDVAQIERWLVGHIHELCANHVDIPELRRASHLVGAGLRGRFEAVFDTWLDSVFPRA